MRKETRIYLAEFFKQRSMITISQEISTAFQKGYLFNSRSEYFNKYAVSLSLAQFIKEYKRVWEVHDSFSLKLLGLVPKLAKLSSPEKICKKLLPLLTIALENDARLMGFTQCLNETKPKNKISDIKHRLGEIFKKAGVNTNLINTFFFPQFDTFEVELLKEALQFLSNLDIRFRKEICFLHSDPKILKKYSDFAKLELLADKWTFGDIEQLLLKLKLYCKISPSVLEKIENQKHRLQYNFERQKKIVRQKLELKDAKEVDQFEELIEVIQELLYMDHYFEPKSRFSMSGGLGDYLLRDLVARVLFKQGYLNSPNPMENNQQEILLLLKKSVISK